jgi:hypothetical protein
VVTTDVTPSSNSGPPRLTVEVRWIVEGACPDETRQRFVGPAPPSPEERTDLYLLTGAGTVGVKLRGGEGGGLDIKIRRASRDSAVAGAGGCIEEWESWSFDADADDGLDRSSWIPVTKRRWQRTWNTAGAVAQPTDEEVEQGVSIELTELWTPTSTAWTVAAEAWGGTPTAGAMDIAEVVRHEWPSLPDEYLRPDTSRSYPAWLEGAAP